MIHRATRRCDCIQMFLYTYAIREDISRAVASLSRGGYGPQRCFIVFNGHFHFFFSVSEHLLKARSIVFSNSESFVNARLNIQSRSACNETVNRPGAFKRTGEPFLFNLAEYRADAMLRWTAPTKKSRIKKLARAVTTCVHESR